jgi:hypothetical protein
MISTRFLQRLAPKLAILSIAAASLAATGAANTAFAQAGAQEAVVLGTFNDWAAYTGGTGNAKVCYAFSQPSARRPDTLRRGPGAIFVSFRPGENVSNEVAVTMGFPTQEAQAARGVVDGTTFTFTTQGENAFVADDEDEARIVAAFMAGRQLELHVKSARGNDTTDVYSLSGFTAAVRRAQEECR